MDGILLVAHGSKKDNACIEHLAQEVQELSGIPTTLGYKRFGEPKIRHAFETISRSGIDRLAVIPLFMSDGRYVQSIPRNLGLVAGLSSGVVKCNGQELALTVTAPVGIDARVVDAVLSLVVNVCSDDPTVTGVALVGHGASRDGDDPTSRALEDAGYRTEWITENLSEGLTSAIDRLRSDGCDTVVTVPMRMSPLRLRPIENVIVTEPAGTSHDIALIACQMALDILG